MPLGRTPWPVARMFAHGGMTPTSPIVISAPDDKGMRIGLRIDRAGNAGVNGEMNAYKPLATPLQHRSKALLCLYP